MGGKALEVEKGGLNTQVLDWGIRGAAGCRLLTFTGWGIEKGREPVYKMPSASLPGF